MSGKTTTGVLADFVASLDYDHLPAELVRRVTRQRLDLTGVALAGSGQPAGSVPPRPRPQRSSAQPA